MGRYEILYNAAVSAKSADEFRSNNFVRNWNAESIYSEFRGVTMAELLEEEHNLSEKTNFASLPMQFDIQHEEIQHGPDNGYDVSADHMDFAALRDKDLPALREEIGTYFGSIFRNQLHLVGYVGRPACSLLEAIERDLTGEPIYYIRFVQFSTLIPSNQRARPAAK